MNLDIFDRRRAERFAQLLDETNGGLRHHARGQADDQLNDLVSIGHTLSAVRPAVQVDAEFRTGLRAMLVATAERDGIGETATTASESAHAVTPQSRRAGALARGTGRRIRARGAIVLGVAAGAIAVSGLSNASENAAPGDALYGVKRSTERAQMALAGSDVTRGQLSLDFARTRLAEAGALDGDDPAFADVLKDMDNDTRQGVKLLTTSAVARKDKAPLTVIDTFVTGQRRTFAPMLDKLGTANQQRALASMSLLDDIDRRARGLRTGIECGTDGTVEVDLLGPKPQACWAGSQNPDAEEPGTGRTGTSGRATDKVRPGTSRPAAEPGVDGTSVGGTSVDGTSVDGTSVGGTSVGGTSVGGSSVGGDSTGRGSTDRNAPGRASVDGGATDPGAGEPAGKPAGTSPATEPAEEPPATKEDEGFLEDLLDGLG